MRQDQFNKEFKQTYPDFQTLSLTDRRLTYNDLMEQYFKDGLITESQRYNWGHPKFLTTNKWKISFRTNCH